MNKHYTKSITIVLLFVLVFFKWEHTAAQNIKLYGMTAVGKGIFEYDLASGALIPKTNFSLHPQDGLSGFGSLMKASNGKIYGMTHDGGIAGSGVIFEFDPITGVNKFVHQFNGTDGQSPYGSLLDAGNGKLYGMTNEGGLYDKGVIFEYVLATGVYTKIVDFKTLDPNANGGNPYGSLMKASNGKLYGMTNQGNSSAFPGAKNGNIFELDPSNNQFTVKRGFSGATGTAYTPKGDLVEAHNGKLYGLAGGGMEGRGCIIEFDIATSVITVKYYWRVTNPNNQTTSEGSNPEGSLCLGADSLLYGLTKDGGTTVPGTGSGVLFTYDPRTDVYTKKHSIDPTLIGSQPRGTLIQASNGKFYGMVYRGGTAQNKDGGLFEYDPIADTIVSLHFFDDNDFKDAFYGKLLEIDLGTTAIQTINANTVFTCYPNPATNTLFVKSTSPIEEVSITDLTGKVLLTSANLSSNEVQLSIADLNPGMYFVNVQTKGVLSTQKWIKQ